MTGLTQLPLPARLRKLAAAAVLLLFSAAIPGMAAAAPPSITNGLVVYAPFDGGSSQFTVPAAGGTVTGTTPVTGLYGNAARFNGTTDIARAPVSLPSSSAFTIAAWVSAPAAASNWQAVALLQNAKKNNTPGGLYAFDDQGKVNAFLRTGSGDRYLRGPQLTPGRWTHLAMTYDGASVVQLYVNGKLAGSGKLGKAISLTSASLAIGADDVWSGQEGFRNGSIDDLRLYNRVLTASELQTLGTAPSQALSVSMTASPTSGTAPLAVSFTASASQTATYSWNFGDGQTSASQNPSHTYAAAGTYTATVTATAGGSTATASQTVTATTAAAATGPSVNPTASANGLQVSFAANATAGSSAIASYAWSFGDGSTSAAANPSHTYAASGTYTVTLTVTAQNNRSASKTVSVTVTAPPLSASASADPSSGPAPLAVSFTATGSNGTGTLSYSWNFGDGSLGGAGQNPSHAYSKAGNYTATVTVTDSAGGSATASAGVTVSTASSAAGVISLPYGDQIPDFGANPTIASVQSGNWSDPATWNQGRVPTDSDIVSIRPATTVVYDATASNVLATVSVEATGTLSFRTDVTTKMVLANALLVKDGGTLTVGSAAAPEDPSAVAEIVFADAPMDTALDPKQWGHGLIVLGRMTASGAPLSDTFVRLGADARAGDTMLTLSKAVTGWRTGDKLVVPDTRQLEDNSAPVDVQIGANYKPEWELVSVASVSGDGKTVTLTAPLTYDHLGARDAQNKLAVLGDGTTLLPHVMDITRNVKIHSASATQAYRGHAVFLGRADVDIRYVQFTGMGRTKAAELANARDNNLALPTDDRNPVQFRNLIGPAAIPADGYQYTFIGNSVFCPLNPMPFAWGININNSHFGLIQGNTLYNWAGAGLVTKTNNEYHNVIDGNAVFVTTGDGVRVDTTGASGSAFWLSGVLNTVRNNVAADVARSADGVYSYGYNVFGYYDDKITVPANQGADPSVAGQSMQVDANATPLPDFSNNEAYAVQHGLTLWWLGSFFETIRGNAGTVNHFTVWNNYGWGIFLYETHGLTIDGYTDIDNPGPMDMLQDAGLYFADYSTTAFTLSNARFENLIEGIETPMHCGRGVSAADATFTVQSSVFNNMLQGGDAITVEGLSSVNGSDGLTPCTESFTDLTFNTPGVYIGRDLGSSNGALNQAATNQMQLSASGLNGDPTAKYQLYFSTNKTANALNDPKLGWSVKQ